MIEPTFRHGYMSGKDFYFHCEDGPAVQFPSGTTLYYFDNKHHREDGPAVSFANGSYTYLIHGKKHRADGPAVVIVGEHPVEEWWLNGMRHRTDAPACVYGDSIKGVHQEWWVNGKLHRLEGPAVQYKDGSVKYCVFNRYCGNTIIEALCRAQNTRSKELSHMWEAFSLHWEAA